MVCCIVFWVDVDQCIEYVWVGQYVCLCGFGDVVFFGDGDFWIDEDVCIDECGIIYFVCVQVVYVVYVGCCGEQCVDFGCVGCIECVVGEVL